MFRLLVLTMMALLVSPVWAVNASQSPDKGSASASGKKVNPDDPWEGFNRKVFIFNDKFDSYLAKPLAKGYRKATPGWLDNTVTRFFQNLRDLRSTINDVFQWKWHEAGQNFGRFAINTTLGVAGLFDVASRVDLDKKDEDFGLTLARWGVKSGPYVVLPFLGPATVRSGVGMIPDHYLWATTYLEEEQHSYIAYGLYKLDERADLLDFEKSIVGDRYTFIRNAYLQNRRFKAGEQQQSMDDFGSGFGGGDGSW